MTYLSRIRINPLRSASRALLTNPRKLHAAVVGGCPDRPMQERPLWRLDTDNPRRPHLIVLTESHPDWTHIVEQAGWPDADGDHALVRDYSPLLTQLALGREFAFRVTANPVQNTSTPDKPTDTQHERARGGQRRSHRIGHRTAAAQLGWFQHRATRWGFDLPLARTESTTLDLGDTESTETTTDVARDMRITTRNRLSFTKNNGGKPVVLHTATFEGRLRISDPDLFTRTLLRGIGPAKAYGCGLLTLAPLIGPLPAGA